MTKKSEKKKATNTKVSKSKDDVKPSKLEIKNYDDKKVFEKEKTAFLSKRKKRVKAQKENSSLPASMKKIVSEYGDVMANVGASDMSKYDTFKKYSKNKKGKK